MMVGKPGSPGEFRLCVDVKRPKCGGYENSLANASYVVLMKKLAGSTMYAKLDAFKGYWLFPVTPKCGELYSIKTPFGVFTARRIIQGAQQAVKYFQAGMEEALQIDKRGDLLLWVDDIVSHVSSYAEFATKFGTHIPLLPGSQDSTEPQEV